jgi:hypothetical protein
MLRDSDPRGGERPPVVRDVVIDQIGCGGVERDLGGPVRLIASARWYWQPID